MKTENESWRGLNALYNEIEKRNTRKLYLAVLSIIVFVFVAGVLLSTVSCHFIHEGKVIDRYYESSEEYTYTTFYYINNVAYPQINTAYDDEDFMLIVEGVKNGQKVREHFKVSSSTWKCKEPGTQFNDSVDCVLDDDRKE